MFLRGVCVKLRNFPLKKVLNRRLSLCLTPWDEAEVGLLAIFPFPRSIELVGKIFLYHLANKYASNSLALVHGRQGSKFREVAPERSIIQLSKMARKEIKIWELRLRWALLPSSLRQEIHSMGKILENEMYNFIKRATPVENYLWKWQLFCRITILTLKATNIAGCKTDDCSASDGFPFLLTLHLE